MPLCTACSKISLESLQEGYSHLQDAQQLRVSSETCSLCRLIRLSLNRDTVKEVGNDFEFRYYELEVVDAPIVLHGVFREDLEEEGDMNGDAAKEVKLVGIDVHVPLVGDDVDIANIGVFSKQGKEPSSGSNFIAGRPYLQSSGSESAMELIRTWLQTCIHSHPRCAQTISGPGDLPALPTRVLDVTENHIHLAVPRNQRDRYAALSHCWGRDPPLRTVKANYDAHQMSINFNTLPKTFQEAVLVTRALGLRYVWIDSLCIIQDDKSDWEREVVKMAMVYEGAEATVAATGSSNAHEGCFIPRPKMADPVPFNISFRGKSVIACATLRPESALADLQKNPLAERGWITQEWLLSRRTVHFGKGDLRWICRTESETETGDAFTDTSGTQRIRDALDSPQSWDFLEEWLDVVSTYCRRHLTYPSDKPVALQGIIDALARRIGKECCYGVWNFSIHQQLFWFASTTLSRPPELAHMPSWSWLSTYGRIHYNAPTLSGHLARSMSSDDTASVSIVDKRLHIYAQAFEYGKLDGPFILQIPDEEKVYQARTTQQVVFIQDKVKTYMGEQLTMFSRVGSQHFYGVHSKGGAAVGWISFDTGSIPQGKVVCAQLSSNTDEFWVGTSFLTIQKDHTRSDVWLRVGMGELIDTSPLNNATWSSFQIE